MYSFTPTRAIVLAFKDLNNFPNVKKDIPIDKQRFKDNRKITSDGCILKVKVLYDKDVDKINNSLIELSKEGYIVSE